MEGSSRRGTKAPSLHSSAPDELLLTPSARDQRFSTFSNGNGDPAPPQALLTSSDSALLIA